MKLKNKKGFTLIELIVVIAILGVLVLLAAPRLLGYTDKAELTRIQHDTKVMEQEMDQILIKDESKIASWDKNGKELGVLVMQEKLFEKEGLASKVEKGNLGGFSKVKRGLSSISNGELGVGGDLYKVDEQLTSRITTRGEDTESLSGDGYKIVPEDYKGKIKTKLKGTFYTNENGKVYYENDKPLKADKDVKISCESPEALPDYEFDHETGTIIKWNGNQEHLVIPQAFKNTATGECTTVRIIGEGAFMQGGFQSIVIPDTVVIIRSEAFKDNKLTEVNIPHSVTEVGNGAFDNNNIGSGSGSYGNKDTIFGGGKDFEQNGVGGNVSITPEYRAPSAKDADVIFSGGAIIAGKPGKTEITIPDEINVGGVNYPVTEIAKGAYQGLGLKSVVLPSGLERIEDYAFSGNQLVGITIPEKVSYIGHYAFAFNEQSHSKTGTKRATIKNIKMQNGAGLEEQFKKLSKYGDIQTEGKKAEKIGIIQLRDFIFVTSIDNHVIDEKYLGTNPKPSNPGMPSKPEGGLREPEADEIAVYTAEDLNNMRLNLGAKYILMADIDLSVYENWQPIASGSHGTAVGGIDGNGFKIKNLTINRKANNVGLYGNITRAEINNLALENVNIVGGANVGGIAGMIGSLSKVQNSYVTGLVSGRKDVGLLAGTVQLVVSVNNSYTKGTVEGENETIYTLGGLFGSFAGGSKVENSYSVAKVGGPINRVGALAYEINSTKTDNGAQGLHWNTDLSGKIKPISVSYNDISGIKANTDSEMKKQSTYVGWDFEKIWEIKEGQSYPTLQSTPER